MASKITDRTTSRTGVEAVSAFELQYCPSQTVYLQSAACRKLKSAVPIASQACGRGNPRWWHKLRGYLHACMQGAFTPLRQEQSHMPPCNRSICPTHFCMPLLLP